MVVSFKRGDLIYEFNGVAGRIQSTNLFGTMTTTIELHVNGLTDERDYSTKADKSCGLAGKPGGACRTHSS
jgi:hypothetical protein